MKTSKQVESKIRDAIEQLERGLAFIDQDKTKIVRLTSCAGLPADNWTSQERQTGISIDKQIGSELCYLRNACKTLRAIITPVIIEKS